MFKDYKRLPKTVNAVHFTSENKDMVLNSLTGQVSADWGEDGSPIIRVVTIHGDIAVVRLGDWIIKEPVVGRYYPIKHEIFRASYEPA